MEPVRVEGLKRSYGSTVAVAGVSFALEQGATYGLLGRNGAGKSTLIRLILGLDRPDAGSVLLFGEPPSDPGRARVGYIPEERVLPEGHKVVHALEFVGRIRGRGADVARRDAERWIDRLALTDQADTRIAKLNNGAKQRVQIAIALMAAPDLLVADEPMTALDLDNQLLAWELFREAVDSGATMVVSTHRLLEVESEIERVLVMAAGRIVLDGRLDEVREPDEPLEALFLRVAGEAA